MSEERLSEEKASCECKALPFYPVIVAGAGPAGMAAAASAAGSGVPVLLLERNEKPGKKLLLTGGGRCNISNLAADPALGDRYFGQAKFLRPAWQVLSAEELCRFMAEHGLPLKEDEPGRLYPAQGEAPAVRDFWQQLCSARGVSLHCREKLLDFEPLHSEWLITTSRSRYRCRSLVLACGGAAYPQTGSDGNLLSLLAEKGILTRPFSPALSAVKLDPKPGKAKSGIVLKEISLHASFPENGKIHEISFTGDVLFTIPGLSGTPVLNLSRYLGALSPHEVSLWLNIRPDTRPDQLSEELETLARSKPKMQLKNLPWPALPASLRRDFLELAGIDPEQRAADLSKAALQRLVRQMLHWPLGFAGTFGLDRAMLSRGGILLREINPRKMSLKALPGIYACGELIDLDGECGGFNLQAALCQGWLAGMSAAQDSAP